MFTQILATPTILIDEEHQVRSVSGLRIDWKIGEGTIELPERLLRDTVLFRADVLQAVDLRPPAPTEARKLDKEATLRTLAEAGQRDRAPRVPHPLVVDKSEGLART